MKEILLMLHPALAVLAIIAAVWVVVETINATSANLGRLRKAAGLTSLFMFLTWLAGGYFYVVYYAAEKALILKGPWAFAHNFFMEVKEHLFFVPLVLALFLPIATRSKDIATNPKVRTLIISVAVLIILTSLALDGAGAVISLGVKMGLIAGTAN